MPTPYTTTHEQVAYQVAWAKYEGLREAEMAAVGTPAAARLTDMTNKAWQTVCSASVVARADNTPAETRLLAARL